MTAEIAIVNRTALALAADSAVTIRIGNKLKIYDSAEKIFEFSRRQPIGIMIYNNVEVVNVPLDVLIRKFRNEEIGVYNTIVQSADHFLKYIEEFPRDVEDEKSHLFPLLFESFKRLSEKLTRTMGRKIREFGTKLKEVVEAHSGDGAPPVPDFDLAPEKELLKIIQAEINREIGRQLTGFLDDHTIEEFESRHADVVENAIQRSFNLPIDITDEIKQKLKEYAWCLVKSSEPSNIFTGLVFGGFAKNDLFPQLHYCEMDGIYFGKLKILSRKDVCIDRRGDRAEMLPFAQKEMAERFILGLDSELEGDINKFVHEAINKVLDAKQGAFNQRERDEIKTAVNSNFSSMISKLKSNSRKNILDMVNFMSKKELGEMAQALVELTSKKRRFSTDQDTVGGPIDVAIVTRNEGFIWIQRKHYFDPALNPNFNTRNYVGRIGANHGGKAPRPSKRTTPTTKGRKR